ncbi:D-Ala-D-Ala carboxypeptidase family metallohydrolase [bacterium]|nr:D-Ala-D-Ala carboxypeptidase family metallohydrolase [bacterium]
MIKLLEDVQVTKNFKFDEFSNHLKDGTYLKIEMDLIYKLQQIRDIVGSITITSGFRTETFNKSVGGSSNSYHIEGKAADIRFNFDAWSIETLTKLFSGIGFGNLGIYLNPNNSINRLHCDVGEPWKNWDKYNNMSFKVYHV